MTPLSSARKPASAGCGSPRAAKSWPSNGQRAIPGPPGTRAYLSAGLPGADWWVAGAAAASAEDADVELDKVEQLYTERDLWNTLV